MVSIYQEGMPLSRETPLQGGRYRLLKQQEQYHWQTGASETWWIGQDRERRGAQVSICEGTFPGGQAVLPTILCPAMRRLMEIGKHPQIPSLLDVFGERGRHFFVFDLPAGESLAERMNRAGRGLDEREARTCCLQMVEVLEYLAQQRPPVVHGRISPEHLVAAGQGRWMLTTFSILGVSDAQSLTALERAHLAAYTAPEFGQGPVTWQSDLYAVMATIATGLTGTLPSGQRGGMWQVQATLSAQATAFFTRALHPNARERYQRFAELRQALGGTTSSTGQRHSRRRSGPEMAVVGSAMEPAQNVALPAPASTEPVARSEPLSIRDEHGSSLVPPDEMLPVGERNTARAASLWLGSLLVLGMLVVLFAR